MNDELEQFYLQKIAELSATSARREGLLQVTNAQLREELARLQAQLTIHQTEQTGESNGIPGDE